jgi:hypothetical protein
VDNHHVGKIRLTTVPVYRKKKQEVIPLYLSPSSILSFRQCRQRYKFLYIDKLGDQYGRPRPYFTMANHVHATLRDFLSLHPIELRTPSAIEELLWRNWRRYRTGFRDKADESRWAQKALAQLRAFVTNHHVSVRPVMMEEPMEAQVTPGLILRSRIDRLDAEPDGSLHIIDYKTGSLPEDMDWTQLELHALTVSKRLPQPVTKVSYLYLGPSVMHSMSMSPGILRRVHWDVLTMARKVRREKRFSPTVGIWCSGCDFVSICPKGAEAEQLAAPAGQLELWDHVGCD